MRFWLTCLAIFVELLGITTSAANRALRDTANEGGNVGVCLTEVCNATAAEIISSMDTTVNPCEDFYEYTCGNFLKRELPSGTPFVSATSVSRTSFQSQLRSFFEANFADDDIRPYKQQKMLYQACMNEDAIERKGVLPLKIYTQILGGWPVVEEDSWNEGNFDWMATTAGWNRAGFESNTFMYIGITTDRQNFLQYFLTIKRPSWIIKMSRLTSGFNATASARAYYNMMVDVAVSLGADRQKAQDEIKEALLFQVELSKTMQAAGQGKVSMTVKKLIEDYPRVNWRDTFARMYSPTQPIRDDDVVIVHSPLFINNVIDLVSNTPKRVLANFAVFQIIAPMMQFMNKEIVEMYNAYISTENNYSDDAHRWLSCTNLVMTGMATGVVHMYAKKLLKNETIVQFNDIVQTIRQEFRTNIDKVSFLDFSSKTTSKAKESMIAVSIGHPTPLLSNSALEEYYQDLDLFDDDFFNFIRLRKFNYDLQVRNYRKSIDYIYSEDEYRNLLDSVAYATQFLNLITFAPIVLQGRHFNPDRPRYINFATAGTTIAHEITHLFDGVGSHVAWGAMDIGQGRGIFTMLANARFRLAVRCLENQYGNYTDPATGRQMDGVKCSDENIADNAGVLRAYNAYVNSVSGKAPEKRLPGLDFTPEQMFWIAYGNRYCEKGLLSYMQTGWEKNNHSPSRYRVIGPLSNSKEFAKDFNCEVRSGMNPETKCSVW